MTTQIEIRPGMNGALATPKAGGKAPGVIVIHEWHGLVDSVKTITDRFAAEGFVALAPDLYHGTVAKDDAQAAELMQKLKTADAMVDVGATLKTLAARPDCNGKVAVVGFCMGGALSFAAASAVDGLRCAVPFYGIPIADYWNPKNVRVPVLAHFAKRDDWAKPERADEFCKAVNAAGGRMELHVYDAGHAFMRANDSSKHDAPSAALAWKRTLEFLRRELA